MLTQHVDTACLSRSTSCGRRIMMPIYTRVCTLQRRIPEMSSVNTYPPAEPHRIMTSTTDALREVASACMIRHHEMDDDLDYQPEKKSTQAEQDVEDEKARKRAMRNLVNSWQERLQLISVITTFFASTEAAMLVNTKPGNGDDFRNNALQVANASLLGALIVHVYASVLSFLGAFLLISYKLREATREEMIVEGIPVTSSPLTRHVLRDVERHPIHLGTQRVPTTNEAPSTRHNTLTNGATQEHSKKRGLFPVEPPIFSANPHVEQVGPFKSNVSSHRLLSRTHAICIFLAGVGFILNMVGILCYSWALQPKAVSIFASACLGAAFLTMFALRI